MKYLFSNNTIEDDTGWNKDRLGDFVKFQKYRYADKIECTKKSENLLDLGIELVDLLEIKMTNTHGTEVTMYDCYTEGVLEMVKVNDSLKIMALWKRTSPNTFERYEV